MLRRGKSSARSRTPRRRGAFVEDEERRKLRFAGLSVGNSLAGKETKLARTTVALSPTSTPLPHDPAEPGGQQGAWAQLSREQCSVARNDVQLSKGRRGLPSVSVRDRAAAGLDGRAGGRGGMSGVPLSAVQSWRSRHAEDSESVEGMVETDAVGRFW